MDALSEDQLKQRLKALGVKVKTVELNYDLVKKQKIVQCELRLKKPDLFEVSRKVVGDLKGCPGVLQIQWV